MNVADWTVKISIKRMWLLKTAAYMRFFTDVLTKKFYHERNA